MLAAAALVGCTGHGLHSRSRAGVDSVFEISALMEQRRWEDAMRRAEQSIETVSDFTSYNDQSKFEAYIVRGICWYTIGLSKIMLAVPQEEAGVYRYTDLFSLEGTPEGGAIEFRKAIAEIDQALAMPRRFVAFHDPYFYAARSHEWLGEFRLADEKFKEGIAHARDYALAKLVRVLLLYRALCAVMDAWHTEIAGPANRERCLALLERARTHVGEARTSDGSPEGRAAADRAAAEIDRAAKFFE